jgi:TRAP transporter TAXI family solute receptor
MRRLVQIIWCRSSSPLRPLAVLAAATIGMLLVVPLAHAQSHKDWPSRVTFATGPTGGFGYTMAAPWSATVGAATGVAISPEVTSGIPFNVQMTETKQAEIGVGTSDIVVIGLKGQGFFKGKKPITDVRTLFMFVPFVLQMYTDARSNIKTVEDLNGKSMNPSRRGSQTDVVLRTLVKTLDLKPKQITNVSPPQANDLMADGRLDVAMASGAVPHPAATQFEARLPLRIIGLTKAQQNKFIAANPQLSPMTIPANSFKGQTEPKLSVGSYTMVVVNKDLPADFVYAILKATYDHKTDLAHAYKAYNKLDYKSILNSPIPLHAGAVKFFEEHGIKIPDKLKG